MSSYYTGSLCLRRRIWSKYMFGSHSRCQASFWGEASLRVNYISEWYTRTRGQNHKPCLCCKKPGFFCAELLSLNVVLSSSMMQHKRGHSLAMWETFRQFFQILVCYWKISHRGIEIPLHLNFGLLHFHFSSYVRNIMFASAWHSFCNTPQAS